MRIRHLAAIVGFVLAAAPAWAASLPGLTPGNSLSELMNKPRSYDNLSDYAFESDRPPSVHDDITKGFSVGRVVRLDMLSSGGSGNTSVSCSVAAPPAALGSRTATCHAVLSGGVVQQFVLDDGGQGYTSVPTITVVGNPNAVSAPTPIVEPPTIWNYRGQLYYPVDLSKDAALWVRVGSENPSAPGQMPLPVDAATAAGAAVPNFAVGVMRLRRAYTTNAVFDLLRASDSATLTVGFSHGGTGNVADFAAADSFCAGTTCTVTKWYNQGSGSGDATASGTAAPGYYGNLVGTLRSLTFDSLQTTGAQSPYMTIPNTVSFTPATQTVVALARSGSAAVQTVGMGMNSAAYLVEYNHGTQSGMRTPGMTSSLVAPSSPDVHFWVMNGSAATIGNTKYIAGSKVTAAPTGTYTDATIGANLSNGNGGKQELAAFISWNSVLTVAQVQAAQQALSQWAGLAPQVRAEVIGSGDSIMFGGVTSYNRNWFGQLWRYLPVRTYNFGVGGQDIAFSSAAFSTAHSKVWNPFIPRLTYVIEDGVNTFGAKNLSLAQAQSDLQGYLTQILGLNTNAYGVSNVSVVFQTLMQPCSTTVAGIAACPRFTSGQLANLNGYNTWLRANWQALGGSALIDVDAIPFFGATGFSNSVLTGDGLHPSIAGNDAIGDAYRQTLRQQIR